ncbi:SNF2 domain-containing protein CLASSY 3-like [Fagus crenata]
MFPDCGPVIIAPASLLLTWEEEFKKWNVGVPFHNLNNLEFSGKESVAAVNVLNKSRHQTQDKNAIHMVKLFSWCQDKSILGVSYSLYEKLAGEKFSKDEGTNFKRKVARETENEKFRKILLNFPGLLVLDEGHTPRNQRSSIWKETDERKKVMKEVQDSISSSAGSHADEEIKKFKALVAPFVNVHKGSILQKSLPGLRDCVVVLNPPDMQKRLLESIRERQAISRAYRIGQKKVVYTYHLITRGTTECDKYCKQAEKDRLSELVFSASNNENDMQKSSVVVSDDKVLDEMVRHEKLKDMFEKIIYQPKESDLVESFSSMLLP